MITFKINDIDISNDVILNTFNYMNRIDEVFGTGSFQFESSTINYNIPPYSVLIIDNKYYLCSSEATYHYGKQSWFHNVSVIEATSILSRFLVGSKAFSITGTNTLDYEKINILIALINEKYNVSIGFDFTLSDVFNKEIEYVFTAGTTLFDALNEISKQYNIRFYVSKIINDAITISYHDLSNLNNFNYSNDKVLSLTKIQNSETYCKYLESEAKNVIDTNQLVKLKNIYMTSNDIKLAEDTFVLKLPTPIYKVESLIAVMPAEMDVWISFTDVSDEINNIAESTTKTYGEWAVLLPQLNTLYDEVFANYRYNEDFYQIKWLVQRKDGIFAIRPFTNALIKDIKYENKFDILSKEQYDLLLDKDKPDYVYYTLGSNIIDGFNIQYKNDFWNTLLGSNNMPKFFDTIYDNTYQNYEFEGGFINKFSVYNGTIDTPIMDSVFDIEYYPIANPYMIDVKTEKPSNEANYKPYSISYNKSSNYVDFDKMQNSMSIENKSIGKTEMVLEYDTTDFAIGYPFNMKLVIDDKTWYIISSETRFNGTQQISRFNLVSNYNKIADVVSLNSQYNTVENPLQNIIERPIYIENNDKIEITQGKTHIALTIIGNNETYHNLYMPFVVFRNLNDTYLYFEMSDQYSAGKNAIKVSTNVYKANDVSYVDDNNELTTIFFNLVNIDELSVEQSKLMPQYNGNYDIIKSLGVKNIYKDAREKLTFTIKLNNCIIK